MYDIIVVGGGPAGLTAAIKAGTEGLRTLVLERGENVGGRPYQSPLIENVPGWPEGVSGPELFGRLRDQALKFGAEIHTGSAVLGVFRGPHSIRANVDGDGSYTGRSVILAMGEVTPKLDALRPFEGRGVDYACDAALLDQHAGQHVVLVGGGNSCAQLALALADTDAKTVTVVSRSPLLQTVSLYLRSRLASSRINVVVGEVARGIARVSMDGMMLGGIEVEHRKGSGVTLKADQVYVFIGGVPPTGWFSGALDAHGYILTGHDVPLEDWPLDRHPYPQESSIPGVFVAGDVRAGATGGITVAFGEGTQAFQWIKREYLPSLSAPADSDELVPFLKSLGGA